MGHPTTLERANPLVDALHRRLGDRELARVTDVASACNVSSDLVLAWIDAGCINGVNVGRGNRPTWMVHVPSVLAFYRERSGRS
jgi:hypothetical protein